MLMLSLQMWSYNNSAAVTVPIDNTGGLPSQMMSNSSGTGISLSNGNLRLDSTKASYVYALFPYIPFNTSEPSMGSFNTYFNFTNSSSAGALGFITIDPDSDTMKLEDRLLAITNLPYISVDTSTTELVNHSNYLALVYNFTAETASQDAYSTARIGDGSVVFFDYIYSMGIAPSDRARHFSGELQYINPASVSKVCAYIPEDGDSVLNDTNTACPKNSVGFGIYHRPSGYIIMGAGTRSNLSVSVPSLVGFFAFGGGVFDVSFWQFTTLYTNNNVVVGTAGTILIASSVSSIPYPCSLLIFMLLLSLFVFFYV